MLKDLLLDFGAAVERGNVAGYREEFLAAGVVVIKGWLRPPALSLLQAEVGRLRGLMRRRDILVAESNNTRRRMSTLGGVVVAAESSMIPMQYYDQELLRVLSNIAGEVVLPAADRNENHVINCLEQASDVHGRHKDVYAFAFNIPVQVPSPGAGGLLRVHYDSGGFRDVALTLGDVYFMRTDLYEHEVLELTQPEERIVINYAYAVASNNPSASYSSSALYGQE